MKKQIKEIQAYFKNKLVTGDFIIHEPSMLSYSFLVTIDDVYIFCFTVENIFNQSKYDYSFMDIDLTGKDLVSFTEKARPIIEKYRKNDLIKQKKQELEDLINS